MLIFAFLRASSRCVAPLLQRVTAWFRAVDQMRGRSRAIDVLRAVAIFLVIGCHYVVHPSDAGSLSPLAGAWYRVGWAGVDLFFVLSGYLVSGLLFAEYRRTGAIDVRRFLVRRSLKIWPGYFAYLAFLALWFTWQRAHGKPVDVFDSLRANLLHLQNYFGTPREHTWSLAVEEHFYLTLALLGSTALAFAPFRRALRRSLSLGAVATLIGLAAWRHFEFVRVGRDAMNLYATHLRFDGLLVGTLLAYLHQFRPQLLTWSARRPLATIAGGAALALPTMIATPDLNAWTAGAGLSVMYIGFALVVIGCVQLERTTRGAVIFGSGVAGWVARTGFYSYGIYLWHIDLVQTPLKKLVAHPLLAALPPSALWLSAALAYVALAITAGAIMSHLIELPALALRERTLTAKPPQPSGVPRLAPVALTRNHAESLPQMARIVANPE